jgi:phosphatidylglycerol---prolipoprotein diacylglyceryl transferase
MLEYQPDAEIIPVPTLYTTIGPWTFPTFNLLLMLAVLVSASLGLRRTAYPGRVADAYLGALAGAVVGARLFHVLLNWNYFAENLHEASKISLGGLDWHGGVLGGLIGLYGALWLRHWLAMRRGLSPIDPYRYTDLVDSLIPALPLIGLAGWWGCLAASCGYGAEVDNLSNYPAFAVSEMADVYGIAVPRYNTQIFGLILSMGVLVVAGLLMWRGWMRYRRFWLVLALLSAGMFVIGFFRGDSSTYIVNIRADQILDIVFVIGSLVAISFQRSAKE